MPAFSNIIIPTMEVFFPQYTQEEEEGPTEGNHSYAVLVCLFASLSGIFFGYDQGVTGGVLVMDSFRQSFCVGYDNNTMVECQVNSQQLPNNWLSFTIWYNVTYNCGCIIGALLGGWLADRFGRRVTVFWAGFCFCFGASWVCLTPDHDRTSVLFARVFQGAGVGKASFSLPLFNAELAPKELRGFLIGFMQMAVVTGLLLANIMNNIVKNLAHGWRYSNIVAVIPPVIMMCGIFFVPESPRWTFMRKGREEAKSNLQRLRNTDQVDRELKAIADQIQFEGERLQVSWTELLVPSIFRRVLIAMGLQLLQQFTGINPVFTYGGLIFEDVIGNGVLAGLILSSVNFVSTIPAMRWVDTTGRRKLLLLGAVGMMLGHLVSAITFTAGCSTNSNSYDLTSTNTTSTTNCKPLAGWLMVVATCVFIFNFAISWGPVCWVYPAEIFPFNVRAKAVSLSTMANWCAGVIMMFVPKLLPLLHIDGMFFLFAGFCVACGVFVYYLCPETKGLMLEDIEVLFDGGHAAQIERQRREFSPHELAFAAVESPGHAWDHDRDSIPAPEQRIRASWP